jgi:hypothetical protein
MLERQSSPGRKLVIRAVPSPSELKITERWLIALSPGTVISPRKRWADLIVIRAVEAAVGADIPGFLSKFIYSNKPVVNPASFRVYDNFKVKISLTTL